MSSRITPLALFLMFGGFCLTACADDRSTIVRLAGMKMDSPCPALCTAGPEETTNVIQRAKQQDQDKLPKVLVIGDSISLGYTPVLQGMLYKQVNIVRPNNKNGGWVNCQGTKFGVAAIDEWLAMGDFDVIHFNFGLHDLKHVHPETGRNSTDPAHPQQANLEQYEKNLREIVAKLKNTGAKLIFATTTPYPDKPGGPLRRSDQPAKYNQVALQIMKENNIRVNDLHGFVLPRMDELLLPNNVHFRPAANLAMAEQVANEIKAALR